PREAIDLAKAVNVGAHARIATELCRLADPQWGGVPDAFTSDDVNAFLAKVEGVDRLDHDVVQFLKFACERNPLAVVDMLIRRIERQERDGYRSDYRPVPFKALYGTFSGLASTDRHREVLCRIRDYSLEKSGASPYLLADLYRDASQNYGET